jgi:hypothetical protein
MWTEPGNIEIAHRHMNVEFGTEAIAVPRKGVHKWDLNSQKGAHKWDFPCSVDSTRDEEG